MDTVPVYSLTGNSINVNKNLLVNEAVTYIQEILKIPKIVLFANDIQLEEHEKISNYDFVIYQAFTEKVENLKESSIIDHFQSVTTNSKTIPKTTKDQYRKYADAQRYFVDNTLRPCDYQQNVTELLGFNPDRQLVEFYYKLARFDKNLTIDYLLNPSLFITSQQPKEAHLSKRKRQQLKRQGIDVSPYDYGQYQPKAKRGKAAQKSRQPQRVKSDVYLLEKQLSHNEIQMVKSLVNDDVRYDIALQTFIIAEHDYELARSILSS